MQNKGEEMLSYRNFSLFSLIREGCMCLDQRQKVDKSRILPRWGVYLPGLLSTSYFRRLVTHLCVCVCCVGLGLVPPAYPYSLVGFSISSLRRKRERNVL